MSYDVTIKFAPVFTHARFDDPTWAPDRTMYNKLEFLPGKNTVPLLVNHDYDREIGTVHQLYRWDWTDGLWYVAAATVPDDPPAWLKRGARASFEYRALHRSDFTIRETKADLVHRALVSEVSVLTGDREPGEPRAEVLSIRRSKVKPVTAHPVAGEIVHHHYAGRPRTQRRRLFSDDEIRRRIFLADDTGIPGAIEREIEHMRALEAAMR